jgi:hypothetical protein
MFLLAIERSFSTLNDHSDSPEEVVRSIDVEGVMTGSLPDSLHARRNQSA